MKLTNEAREFWEKAVMLGANEKTLRDYDVLCCHDKGMSLTQMAIKFQVDRSTIYRILVKYNKK